MPSPSRFDSDPDPQIRKLVGARRGLLRLHKAFVDAERDRYEAAHGRLSGTQYLRILLEHEDFQWLRAFSTLIIEIDEVLASEKGPTRAQATSFLQRATRLVEPPAGSPEFDRYVTARDSSPEVLIAHVELAAHLRE